MAEYEASAFLSRKGTEPIARPIGMPCKKYNRTSNKKLRWSFLDSSEKPLDCSSPSLPSSGTSSSNVKLERCIRDAAWPAGELRSMDPCLRRCSSILLIVALLFACPFFSLGVPALRLLICVSA